MNKTVKIIITIALAGLPIAAFGIMAIVTQNLSWLYDQLFVCGIIFLIIGLLLFVRYNHIERKHKFGRTTDEYGKTSWGVQLNPKYEAQFEEGYAVSRKHWLMLPLILIGLAYIIISIILVYTR